MAPKTEVAELIHSIKYRTEGESFRDAMQRVAFALSDNGEHYHQIRKILLDQRFMPAGRVQAAMGSGRNVTPYNCLTGDTRIITDKGVITLEEAAEMKEVTILDGLGNWTKAPVYYHGEDEVYSVRITNGRKSHIVRATKDHDWVIESSGERIKTSDLKRNMKVPFICRKTQDYDAWAIIHGFVYGDGTKTKDNGFVAHVCSYHEQTYKWFDKLNIPFSETEKGRLYYMFGENIKAKYKELPDSNVSPEYKTNFIRGLALADGHISKQPEFIISGDEKLVNWMYDQAPSAGFYVTGISQLSNDTNYGKRNKPCFNIRFDLRSISKKDCLRGHDLNVTPSPWRIAEVTKTGEVTSVYCPSVDTNRSFVIHNGAVMGNCYVSGTIEDSFTDGQGSIMQRATEAASTLRMGGGIGYDFSTLRPSGDLIMKLGSYSSGPVSFMEVFNSICSCVASAGHRRGAQMAVMRVDHPDIDKFISCKHANGKLTGFNISVAVTDKFMEAVKSDGDFDLVFNGKVYRTIRARELWEKIMRSTWEWAEPGVLFIDRINQMNNLNYCETIAATNPCGEQPLPPFGACLLGSFNLPQYIREVTPVPGDGAPYLGFNMTALIEDIPAVVRAMDNVVDRAVYPLEQQRQEATSKRRMGLGITGLANVVETLGMPYGSPEAVKWTSNVLNTIANTAYMASAMLAKEKGSFELYNETEYLKSLFVQKLDPEVQQAIKENGIRNSHLTSIAPTGTISLSANNVSSGIEPVFSKDVERPINLPGHEGKVFRITDYAYATWGTEPRDFTQVKAQEHIAMLCAAQEWVDSSVSKTCNVSGEMDWDDFKALYMAAYEGGAKGCTTYTMGASKETLIKKAEPEGGESCKFDPATGERSCE